eukprot:5287463-Amphidinium_carterae.1
MVWQINCRACQEQLDLFREILEAPVQFPSYVKASELDTPVDPLGTIGLFLRLDSPHDYHTTRTVTSLSLESAQKEGGCCKPDCNEDETAISVISGLLERVPELRLGASIRGAKEIKEPCAFTDCKFTLELLF